jgi:urease accessory protein UreE
MKYAIYQIRLTDAQIDRINETQSFESVPAKKAKIDMDMDFSGDKIGGLAYDAFVVNKFYTHVANIEASSPNEVFHIGNIGPEENIERLAQMHSLSVGDVIVDEEGQCIVVAPIGFVAFSHDWRLAAAEVA